MNPLLLASGTRLARLLREGQVSSTDLVELFIEQIGKVNPALNAMVETRFDRARAEAAEADRILSSGSDDRPFLGVPCSIKECFALEGMINTGGLYARRDHRATLDATPVARYRAAGAIPLGTTNVSELCMWMESANTVYGRTSNPYDPTRIVGGSSGGEAAIVSACGAPFGLGSDIGGSIRMPAFFNGIFGHKPTGGMVPNTGQFPVSANEARRYLTTGPLCRRAEDLMPLLRILSGPDGEDGEDMPEALQEPVIDLKGRRIWLIEGNSVVRVSRDVLKGMHRAVRALRRLGADIQTTSIELLRKSFEIWSAMLHAAGGESFRELMGSDAAVNPWLELARWPFGRSEHTFPAIGLGVLESIADRLPDAEKRYLDLGRKLKKELGALLETDNLILYPPYPQPAPRHNAPLLPPFNWIYTAILNVMELPVTQVPTGLNRRGLPLGVQVIAPHRKDYLSIATALHLERTLGGWTPPGTC